MKKINLNNYPVGTHVTYTSGSDRYPYEVIENISSSKIVIRELSHNLEPTNNPPELIELGIKNGKTIFKKVVHELRFTPMYYELEKNNGGFDTFAETNIYKLIWELYEQNLPYQGYTKMKKSSYQVRLYFGEARYYRDPSF